MMSGFSWEVLNYFVQFVAVPPARRGRLALFIVLSYRYRLSDYRKHDRNIALFLVR